MLPPFQLIQNLTDPTVPATLRRILGMLQANIAAVLRPLVAIPLIQGQAVSFTAPGAIQPNTNFTIGHGLGRSVVGILVPLAQGFAAQFSISSTTNPLPEQLMILQSNVYIPKGQSLTFWVY